MDQGNLIVLIIKKRQNRKISSWEVTQQNLWIKSKIKCEKDRKECRTLQIPEKNIQWFGEWSWLRRWMRRHSWERISWRFETPSWIPEISFWSTCLTTSKFVSEQDEINILDNIQWRKNSWKQLSLIGDEFVINLQRTKSMSSKILCCALERSINIRNPTKLGRIRLKGSQLINATETMTVSMESRLNSSGIFPRIHNVAALRLSNKSTERLGRSTRKLSLEEFFLHRCSTTSLVTGNATKNHDSQMRESSKYLQRNLVLDNGYLLVLVPERSVFFGILGKRMVHKEFGIISRKRCCWNSLKVDVQFSVQQLHCPSKLKRKRHGKLSIHFAAD